MLKNAVLITGGSQRVGLHLARQFLQNTHYPLVVTYRTERESIAELQRAGAICLQVDFMQPESLVGLLLQLKAQVASFRAVIHNASIWVNDASVAKQPELFDQLLQLHLQVPWHLNHHLADLLAKTDEKQADIISLTDTSIASGAPEFSAYLSTKAALQNLTLSLAQKWAPKIKVNDIAPGLLMFHPQDSEAYKQARLQRQLLPQEPGPEVIWQAVAYIMQSSYSTGVSLPVDGGVNLGSK